MKERKKEGKDVRSFHRVRHIRISDENYEWILEEKIKNKGTWNYLFSKFRKDLRKQ
jgi:hypothetical protein